MAKIIDPDSLTVAVNATATTQEVEIQTGAKTIELRVAGNLDDNSPGKDSGVTAKALYSFLKEEWLSNTTLRRHRFPIKMIFEGSFIFINGWTPLNQQTQDLLRDAGFLIQSTQEENACIVSLGNMVNPSADQGYYQQESGFTATTTNFDKTGEVNENITIIAPGGSPDLGVYLKLHLREYQKLYAEYNLITEQGLAGLTYQAYRLPLANSDDIKVIAQGDDDTYIDGANAPYNGMKLNFLKGNGFETAAVTTYSLEDVIRDTAGRWAFCTTAGTLDAAGVADYTNNGGSAVFQAYDGEELIGSTYYAFNRVITCNNALNTETHAWAMRQLRKTTDINANDTTSVPQRGFGSVNGEVAKFLTEFVGDTLKPYPGVLLRGFDTNETNDIVHRPITIDQGLDAEFIPVASSEVSFPFVAAGNFNFSSNLVSQPDVDTVYTVYHNYVRTTTNTDIAISGASGATATIGWSGTTLDHLVTGNWLQVSGFTTTDNNGIWEITGAVDTGANTAACTKRDLLTAVANEVAGDTVTVLQNPFNTPGAVIVTNNSAVAMTGQITGATIAWDFDYTNNSDGGRLPNANAPITLVAIAKDGAEWVEVAHTITAATGQNVAVNAGDERNYENP